MNHGKWTSNCTYVHVLNENKIGELDSNSVRDEEDISSTYRRFGL